MPAPTEQEVIAATLALKKETFRIKANSLCLDAIAAGVLLNIEPIPVGATSWTHSIEVVGVGE